MDLCDVCGKAEAVGVACSATGAVSFAYCVECLKTGREPYGALVASLFGMSSMDDVAEWYRPTVAATIKAEGKSVEELFADVDILEREYLEAMRPDESNLNS